LRRLLATQFSGRAQLLKARAALATLDRLVHEVPPGDGGALAASVEEVEAGAHELTELRLLVALRRGGVRLRDDESVEVERLVERSGRPAAERLGLDADAADDGASVTDAIVAAVERWRRRAEHPLADPSVVAAAQVVQRSYEGMLVDV
jgi:hypothetical protein